MTRTPSSSHGPAPCRFVVLGNIIVSEFDARQFLEEPLAGILGESMRSRNLDWEKDSFVRPILAVDKFQNQFCFFLGPNWFWCRSFSRPSRLIENQNQFRHSPGFFKTTSKTFSSKYQFFLGDGVLGRGRAQNNGEALQLKENCPASGVF